ncbi:MAG: hypothetical protein E7374_04110 [Clostridiales bacterium]|nr:hypothetical protein [Clostridiales bacterium]
MNNVIATKVEIFRNLKEYKFLPKLEENKKNEIVEKVEKAVSLNKVDLATLDTNSIDFLKEKELIGNSTYQVVLASKNNDLVVKFFEEEHVSIVSVCSGFNDNVFKNAVKISSELSNNQMLSFNDEYGYLMSNLINLGAGIRLSCEMDLGGLVEIKKIAQVQENVKKLGYRLEVKDEGLFKGDQGFIYVLSTNCNLGMSEKEIWSEFKKMVSKVQDLETESVKFLDSEYHEGLLNWTHRAKAILENCYTLFVFELLLHLKELRYSLNIGENLVDLKTILKLQSLIRNKKLPHNAETDIALAKKVREILKGEKDV